ncbi:MAG: DUF4286 family protein [Phycisphaerales bacterium]|nr:DUF4286 family protein [Phycisphaerales bacterium]
MTTRIAYGVTATFPDQATADDYVAWLEDGHVDAVIAGGAHSALIVRLDLDKPGDPPRVQTMYVFSTRELYNEYVRLHAPALRAEGIKRFGNKGVSFQRVVGEIV